MTTSMRRSCRQCWCPGCLRPLHRPDLGFCGDQLLEEYQGTAQGRQVRRIRYVTQVSVRPPTFAAFVSGTLPFSEGNNKFLVNALRKHFSFPGVPMRLLTRLRKRAARHRSVSRR